MGYNHDFFWSNMSHHYLKATQQFETMLDFMRFGLSLANAQELYYGHGTDNAEDDIRALILSSLHLPWDIDGSYWQARLTNEEKTLLCERLDARINQRIPVPYLTHEAYFCGLPFYVDARVLIPRSPLGELIPQQLAPWVDAAQVHRILDLCTGSACIAIACCYAFPEATVDAIDISIDALAVAAINQEKHALGEPLTLIQSDVFSAIKPAHQYDLIISNPPYVGDEEMATLPLEYGHEPELALRAEDQGLAIVAKILAKAKKYLSDHGILIVEVGNSKQALIDAYPDLPFLWLDFENGGDGVFLLTADQL